MTRRLYAFLLASMVLFYSCKKKEEVRFQRLSSAFTGVEFANQLEESERLNILTYEYLYNGGGVGIGDINNDGLPDLFLGGNMTGSKLYLNQGNLQFKDITTTAGIDSNDHWARGIAMVDINADGLTDIYISRSGPEALLEEQYSNLLYINQGDLTFKEQAAEWGLAYPGNSTQAAFFDYDRDGDLDVYLVKNVMDYQGPNTIRVKRVDGSAPSTDRLFRNNGDHTFTDVSLEANILTEGYGLGISIVDINDDGWPDVYISNDYLSNDLLYINQKNGRFENEIEQYFKHQSYSAMGNDAADIDNDGRVDFITVDMKPYSNERWKNMFGLMNYDRFLSEQRMQYQPQFMRNTLQHHEGVQPGTQQPIFSEVGRYAGIDATDWSWAPLLADYDNDGLKDLLITNGYPRDITNRDFVAYRMGGQRIHPANMADLWKALQEVPGASVPNFLYKNMGELHFSNQSEAWGMDVLSYSNGAAYADLDLDGDLDLVINNLNEAVGIYQNNGEKKPDEHYLRISLVGSRNNTSGLGAKVWVYQNERVQYIEHSPFRGFQSTVENVLHFGLGAALKVDSVKVLWPDQKVQVIKDIKADQVLRVTYSGVAHGKLQVQESLVPLFPFVRNNGIDFKHIDQEYLDFKIQPLLPHLLSKNGPGIAVGDINGDGLDDFFVGGAYGQSGSFFIQTKNQTFLEKVLVTGKKYEEDLGTLLFDADGDGDLDLYVVGGSSEFQPNTPYYQDRIYMNDGLGNFVLGKNRLPLMTGSGSSVAAADFDRDGDLDLFIGGMLSPGQYPNPGESFLLRNEGGEFVNITHSHAKELRSIGMVSSAIWTDYDSDGWVDLIVVGEWMPIIIFKNNKGKLENHTIQAGLQHTSGMWNSIASGDFDEDGDLDYVLGNRGLNIDYRTSVDKPLTMLAKDFDHNGTQDPVIGKYIGDRLFPIHPRDEMTSQMNFLKKRFVYYADYAKADMDAVFSPEEKKGARKLYCEITESVLMLNQGNGKFDLRPLPSSAQHGPVYGLVTGDFDLDGHMDILLSGNSRSTESINGYEDGLNGLFMKGSGTGKFHALKPEQSGVWIPGDAKGLAVLNLGNRDRLLLAAQNNDSLLSFQIPSKRETFLVVPQLTDHAFTIHAAGGKVYRQELSYGTGYLSHSSRSQLVGVNGVDAIYLIDSQNRKRKVYPLRR